MKTSEKLMIRLEGMGIVSRLDWNCARIRRCKSGKHQLALGFWSWEVDFLTGATSYVIGSTSTMLECLESKKLIVNMDGGFITVEPSE